MNTLPVSAMSCSHGRAILSSGMRLFEIWRNVSKSRSPSYPISDTARQKPSQSTVPV